MSVIVRPLNMLGNGASSFGSALFVDNFQRADQSSWGPNYVYPYVRDIPVGGNQGQITTAILTNQGTIGANIAAPAIQTQMLIPVDLAWMANEGRSQFAQLTATTQNLNTLAELMVGVNMSTDPYNSSRGGYVIRIIKDGDVTPDIQRSAIRWSGSPTVADPSFVPPDTVLVNDQAYPITIRLESIFAGTQVTLRSFVNGVLLNTTTDNQNLIGCPALLCATSLANTRFTLTEFRAGTL